MSKFKIRFRDQQTGRNMEVDAKQVEGSWSEGRVEGSFEESSVGDGNVDLMVKSERQFWGWSFDYNHHLGVDTNNLSPQEKAALKEALANPASANFSVFDTMSGRQLSGLNVIKTDAAGELGEVTPNIDPTGARRPVQLTPSGHIATPEGQEPVGFKQIGDGLFRSASLIDDTKGNMFDTIQASLPLKEKMFNNLSEAMDAAKPGQPLPDGMSDKQGLQLRSSAATNMLELMTSKNQTNSEFKTQVFERYEQAIQDETNPTLKESMLFNLDRLKGSLPSALRTKTDSLVNASAPTKPPYDKWFENGNNTVKIDWSCGAGEGFLEDNVAHLKSKGFEQVGGSSHAPILEKTVEKNGVETKFQINFRTIRNNMFEKVGDPDTHMIVYSGHSNWGRNVRDSLENAPNASGDGQVIMTNLCVGKGEMQQMNDKFGDAHNITTYNSGYFRPGNDAEWHYAIDSMIEGIAERNGYQEIADDVRDNNRWTSTHRWNEGIDNNYIFPTDTKIRKEVLDADHDGQADVFDRLVNFNTFDVETDTAREFEAIRPAHPSNNMVGTNIHFAAMSTNRISVYSEVFEQFNGDAEVLPGGYFDPAEGDSSMFKFQREGDRVNMSMNSNYSHMSEEAVRMASAFEYGQFKMEDESNWPYNNKADNLLHSMVFASQSLYSDAGHRDNAVWGEFLKAYNLPDIPLRTVHSARKADSHHYSGSKASVRYLKENLSPEILAQLNEASVGQLK